MLGSDLSIRKVALITCVTTWLGVAMPAWNSTQSIIPLASAGPIWKWVIPPVIVVEYLFLALFPVFCFALYRNEGTIHISKRLRILSLTVALVLGVLSAPDFIVWIENAGQPPTATRILDLFGTLSNLAYILLLVSFFCHRHDGSCNDVAISSFLRIVTKVAVIALGFMAAIHLLRLGVSPVAYHVQFRSWVEIGRTPPPWSQWMKEIFFTALSQACLFAGPFVVSRSLKNTSATATTIKPPA